MRKLFAILLSIVVTSTHAQLINGGGSTFAAPIYSKWAGEYNKETGVKITKFNPIQPSNFRK